MAEIRKLDTGDRAAWTALQAQAMEQGNLDFDSRLPDETEFTQFGLFEGGQLVATIHLWHSELFFDGQRVPAPNVAGVGCLPLARGRGHMEALMQRGLEWMREQDQPLSTLWPFLVGYYRPMGWEWCGSSRSYTLPLAHLPRGIDISNVRPAVPQDAATLQALYEAWVQPYRLAEARRLSWWQERLEAKTGLAHYFYLYEDPEPRGYLYLQLTEPAWLHELAWLAPEAYRALLGVVQRHQSQLGQIRWGAPPDDPLWHHAAHWDVKVEWKPPLSARIVNLPAALALLKPDGALAGRCIIHIQDRLAPWNDGGWQLEVEGGTVTAQRTAAAPQVTCDIGAWSQLFVGDPDLAALRRAGRLTVRNESAYAVLRALCPPSLVWSP